MNRTCMIPVAFLGLILFREFMVNDLRIAKYCCEENQSGNDYGNN